MLSNIDETQKLSAIFLTIMQIFLNQEKCYPFSFWFFKPLQLLCWTIF